MARVSKPYLLVPPPTGDIMLTLTIGIAIILFAASIIEALKKI